MRHLFVVDPLEQLDIGHDTSLAFMWEVQRRGGEVYTCQSHHLSLDGTRLSVDARCVTLNQSDPLVKESSREVVRDDFFSCIWIREDPPFDRDYLLTTYILDHAVPPVINDPSGIRNWNEKLGTLGIERWMPETRVTADRESIREFVDRVGGRAVAKPLFGYGGEGLFVLDQSDPNLSALLGTLTRKGTNRIMIQEYLPEVESEGDRRLLVLGGEPLASLRRRPGRNDFRGNLHSGGSAHQDDLRKVDRTICSDLSPLVVDRGLHFVGLDLVGDRVLEVNVTSPTCLREINELEDRRLETDVLDYVLEL